MGTWPSVPLRMFASGAEFLLNSINVGPNLWLSLLWCICWHDLGALLGRAAIPVIVVLRIAVLTITIVVACGRLTVV